MELESGLGSLAQQSRTKRLKSARAILYFIGVITIAVNVGVVYFASSLVDAQLDREIRALTQQGLEVDEDALAEIRATAVRSTQLVNGIAILIGAVFLVCGALVYTYPVPTTVVSLVLYLGSAAAFGVIDPTTLARGWIVKILIIAGLVKAVQAALAFERERNDQPDVNSPIGDVEPIM
jgi:predicted nucleic acid-binding protein